MTILNTMKSGGGAGSSSEIVIPKGVKGDLFPDFNQILIKPNVTSLRNTTTASLGTDPYKWQAVYVDLSNSISQGITIATNNIERTVGSTPINCFSEILQPDLFYYGNSFGLPVGSTHSISYNSQTTADTTYRFRCAYPLELEGGKTVGKELYYNPLIKTYKASSTSYIYNGLSFEVLVRLLHTDGTFTDIGTLSYSHNPATDEPSVSSNTNYYKNPLLYLSTSGVTSQDGDLVVADYYIDCCSSYSGIIFGSKGGSDLLANAQNPTARTGCYPLQVSIE